MQETSQDEHLMNYRSASPLHRVRTGMVNGRHVGLRLDFITSVL